MKKIIFAIFSIVSSISLAQTINQNQQNVNINFDNLPVIEKPVYITKYRTVYVDRPQPKRVAKRLEKPVLLLGYLWVYPYDLGEFTRNPAGVINNINAQIPYDRNTWRVPDPDELAVMEANANQVGLGDDIYMDTSHRNGIVRLVSTGPTHSEMVAQEQAKRLKEEQERNATQDKEYRLRNDVGYQVSGTIWATRNCDRRTYFDRKDEIIFGENGSGYDFLNPEDGHGVRWINNKPDLPRGWEIPSVKDYEKLFSKGGTYDLENSCWRFGDIILPAAGYFMDKGGGISYDCDKGGRNCGYYLCSDGHFYFNLETRTYKGYPSMKTDRYAWRTYWKLRLIKKKNFNKYYD